MQLTQAQSWRTLLGRVAALFCLLALAAVLDGVVSKFREPANVLDVLPGSTVDANGPAAATVTKVEDLESLSDSPHFNLTFEAVHSGYFLGGNMWRGRLAVAPAASPGKYVLAVRAKGQKPDQPPFLLRVNVHPNPAGLKQSSKSLVRRTLGISPWLAAALCLPFIGLAGGMVFLFSRKLEAALAKQGVAEIYRVARGEGSSEIAFGLGTEHGVTPGDHLNVLDPTGRAVGVAEVLTASAQDAVGAVQGNLEVKAGYYVARGDSHDRLA